MGQGMSGSLQLTMQCALPAQDKAIKALTAALAPRAKAMRNGKLISVRGLLRNALLRKP